MYFVIGKMNQPISLWWYQFVLAALFASQLKSVVNTACLICFSGCDDYS